MRASKWIKVPFLIDEIEMESLFEHLKETVGSFFLYQVQGLSLALEGVISPSAFLQVYSQYVSLLKQGEIPSLEVFRHPFSYAISVSSEAFSTFPLAKGRQLIKATSPVVQMQPNQIRYSKEEKRFRAQVFSHDSISWGVQLAYPQLFQDEKTDEIRSVRGLPNTLLFQAIQKWIRKYTRATPFIVEKKQLNEPIRLGLTCFSWIHSHPQLKTENITVNES
ncbi:MAG: hypothetical protein WAM28_00130 [Chlamydiales bacterium]